MITEPLPIYSGSYMMTGCVKPFPQCCMTTNTANKNNTSLHLLSSCTVFRLGKKQRNVCYSSFKNNATR